MRLARSIEIGSHVKAATAAAEALGPVRLACSWPGASFDWPAPAQVGRAGASSPRQPEARAEIRISMGPRPASGRAGGGRVEKRANVSAENEWLHQQGRG